MDFCDRYGPHFIGRGRNSVGHARHYITGLLGTQRRKNIETIENDVAGSDYQSMEQFISSSPWDHRALLDEVARDASDTIGDETDAGLYIDESSFLKKGSSSVGVQRQWSGRIGKVENCQVGVFAGLGRGDEYALIDFKLYLPESWANDPKRCDKAKIPLPERIYQAKWEIALELVKRARANGVKFGWVGADGLYGNNEGFINALEDAGERFMADIHSNHTVWTERPDLREVAARPAGDGTPRFRMKRGPGFNPASCRRVDKICQDRFDKEAEVITFREGAKGRLTGRFHTQTVWTWDGRNGNPPRQRRLVIREDGSGRFKYTLTNLPDGTAPGRDAYVQNQRYWIEQSFHEAKDQLGMAQYQVRVWQGWNHHMAMICLATVFMVKEKQVNKGDVPLLSCRDIVELLDHYLPRRNRNEEELHRQIEKRHAARQRDIDRRKLHRPGLNESNDSIK